MAERMKRAQILFPEAEYRRLREQASKRGCSVGQLVREAVREAYLRPAASARMEIARRLVAMRLPVSDWPQMEREILQGIEDE